MSQARQVPAWIGLGANLGQPDHTLAAAVRALAALPDTVLERCSSLYRSAPVDAGGPDFINAVAQLRTGLGARQLLTALQAIEQYHGRQRPYRHAPRTLDLDLLLYGDAQIDEPDLQVPHPRMHQRGFVLQPLAELAPDLPVGRHGSAAALAAASADQQVSRLGPMPREDR